MRTTALARGLSVMLRPEGASGRGCRSVCCCFSLLFCVSRESLDPGALPRASTLSLRSPFALLPPHGRLPVPLRKTLFHGRMPGNLHALASLCSRRAASLFRTCPWACKQHTLTNKSTVKVYLYSDTSKLFECHLHSNSSKRLCRPHAGRPWHHSEQALEKELFPLQKSRKVNLLYFT